MERALAGAMLASKRLASDPTIRPQAVPVLRYYRRGKGLGATMRRLILTVALFVGLAAPAWADYQAAMAAYERGD